MLEEDYSLGMNMDDWRDLPEIEVYFECPDCFHMHKEWPSKMEGKTHHCDLCLKKPVRNDSLALLKRRMANIHTSKMCRFPVIVQHLFEHVQLKGKRDA